MTTTTREPVDLDLRCMMDYFDGLDDPRSSVNRVHLLVDIVVMSVCGVVAGADGPTAIAVWAESNKETLEEYLALPGGIPSHDVFNTVLNGLEPAAFQECFVKWLESLQTAGDDDGQWRHISIDGKTARRSHNRTKGLGPLHIVSAWASAQSITLGQLATEEKSNEITAIPELLERIDVSDATVTIDAMGCQTEIAEEIVDRGGDYILTLKANHETLYQEVVDYFAECLENGFADVPVSRFVTHEKGHGRIETRHYYQVDVPDCISQKGRWKNLRTIGIVIRSRQQNGHDSGNVRYYISSHTRNVHQFARAVRAHWSIENTLHWSLDVTFHEDANRTRGRRIADNLSWLRRIAITLLKAHPDKDTLAMKRRKAGWNVKYLLQVVTGKDT